MKILFKKNYEDKTAVPTPIKATEGSAGYDISATAIKKKGWLFPIYSYKTGIHLEIPRGYVGLVFPRSSVYKTKMMVVNSVGVIDSDYRGEISLKFIGFPFSKPYKIGDRIGQLVVVKKNTLEFVQTKELSETKRGEGGYGSTGK